MCCEGIFRLYGTSSQEIEKKAADQQALKDAELLEQTTSELNRLKALLDQHHIAYE